MKPIKTAPQILEHYLGYTGIGDYTDNILKAMRHYARVKIEKEYEKLYQEARENILIQYNLK